tara:strand:+ start:794 stop:1402 length:609 start_codon:yes stop_codon:yes gene_type:complete
MSLKRLQETLGITADGLFGPTTFRHAKEHFELSDNRAVHFFAQVAHETGNFRAFSENLNYSAKGLQSVFGKYFPGNLEESYARQPEKIASRVYANRMGNGDEASGDGWKYRGRGALQLTGKNNYKAFSEYLNKPELLDNPEAVAEEYSFQSALFFFERNNLWSICDKGLDEETVKKLTRRINGGYNGLEHRIELTNKYKRYI